MLIIRPIRVIKFGAIHFILIIREMSYQGDKLDKEFPPMIEDIIQEGVSTGDVFVGLKIFQPFVRDITHIMWFC
jgi:hypothetical protein